MKQPPNFLDGENLMKFVIPVKVREIFTGKPVCSRLTKKSADDYFLDLGRKMGRNLRLKRKGNFFNIRYESSLLFRRAEGAVFRGEYIPKEGHSEIRGKFCCDIGERIWMSVFLLGFCCLPFVSEDHLFGVVAGFLFLHFFGLALYLFDLFKKNQEARILSVLKMKHWDEAGQ